MAVARMRTIDQAWDEVISADPNTALTKTALRRLIVSGQVKACRVGQKYFDPLDIGMVERYNKVSEKFTQALQNIQTGGGLDALNEAGDKIIEFLDYVTGGNSREAFFSKIHPLSPQNGRFYCEQVFEVIGAFIRQSFEAEGAMIDKRVSDHTHGYRTGKHAKGDR